MASLQVEVNRLHVLADDLLAVAHDSVDLELKYQKLIAETALLRLFYSLESAVMNMGFKLLTNSPYADGSHAALTVTPFRGMAAAEAAVLSAARSTRRARFLKWTQLSDFQSNLQPFLAPNEHLLDQRRILDPVFEDMRRVRNHIAHGTPSTGALFATVVARVYGTNPRGISPAKLLLSNRAAYLGAPTAGNPRIIEQYLRWAKVAVKVMAKA